MNSSDRTKTAVILLAVIACMALTAGRASAQAAAGLAAVSAVDPANGYPKWYQDKTVCNSRRAWTPRHPTLSWGEPICAD